LFQKTPARLLLLTALLCATAMGQGYDKSGLLKGRYFYRYLRFTNVTAAGVAGRTRSMIGFMEFDGAGRFTATSYIADTGGGGTTTQPVAGSDNYYLDETGIGVLVLPNAAPTTGFTGAIPQISVGPGGIVGAWTDRGDYDLFVAIPAPANTASAGLQLLNGSYSGIGIDFRAGATANTRAMSFQATSTGNGQLSAFSMRGGGVDLGATVLQQSSANVTYTLENPGIGSLSLGSPGGSTSQSLSSGQKLMFVSADGGSFIAGDAAGYDLIIGARGMTGVHAGPVGTYFTADIAIDTIDAAPGRYMYGYVGSTRTTEDLTTIRHRLWHEKTDAAFDWTFTNKIPAFGTNGSIDEEETFYMEGNNGAMLLFVDRRSPEIFVGIRGFDFSADRNVWIHPYGITSSATYTAPTAPIAPGQFINIYGSGLAPSAVEAQVPFPTTLNSVTVTIGGILAPLYYVSPGLIKALVPFAIDVSSSTLNVVVKNGNSTSNVVSVIPSGQAPGIFTLSQNGAGAAAMQHADYRLVDASNPARPGETLLLYLTGLGGVTPAVKDGAASPASPTANVSNKALSVRINGLEAKISYAGLVPYLAGLYQVNFIVPDKAPRGTSYLEIATNGTISDQAEITIGQ
jgi:uncharacterized protein (TIGR03437 family)